MNPKIESQKNDKLPPSQGSGTPTPIVAVAKEDYGLLSAYIDGEATPEERKLVNQRLDHDREFKKLYLQMLQVRQKFQAMPVPTSEASVGETVQRFFWLLDRRRLRALSVGGSAIAAVFLAAIAGIVPGTSLAPQLSKTLGHQDGSEELAIALNRPIVMIPKAAISPPVDTPPPAKAQPN